jgi:hypothetical protein
MSRLRIVLVLQGAALAALFLFRLEIAAGLLFAAFVYTAVLNHMNREDKKVDAPTPETNPVIFLLDGFHFAQKGFTTQLPPDTDISDPQVAYVGKFIDNPFGKGVRFMPAVEVTREGYRELGRME